jgi:hypothetical protein
MIHSSQYYHAEHNWTMALTLDADRTDELSIRSVIRRDPDALVNGPGQEIDGPPSTHILQAQPPMNKASRWHLTERRVVCIFECESYMNRRILHGENGCILSMFTRRLQPWSSS